VITVVVPPILKLLVTLRSYTLNCVPSKVKFEEPVGLLEASL
jgi:hypothetical protein